MHLALFLTFRGSLEQWSRSGMLEREIAIYRRMASRGVGVDFVSYGGRGEREFLTTFPEAGIAANSLGLPGKIYSRIIPMLHKNLLRRADIIKSNQIMGADTALGAARRLGKKFIARCGYLHSEFAEKAYGDESPAARSARALEGRVFRGADRIVLTTEEMRNRVQNLYAPAERKIRIIPNYVDTDKFSPGERGKERRVIFIGRLVEQKNISVLIEAMEGMNAGLDIIGEGHLRDALEKQAGEKGVSVRFHGNLPHNDLPALLNRASVFVLASHYEGHPKVLLEAMSCGVACVGADSDGIRGIISDGKNALLRPPTADGIRSGIELLLNDERLAARIGREARKHITENLSLDRISSLEYALYEELAAENVNSKEH